MTRRFATPCFFVAQVGACILAGCGSDEGAPPSVDASVDATADTSTASDAAAPPVGSVDALGNEAGGGVAVKGIVVVNSDYQSSSISFLDRDGNLVKDGCLTSGSGSQGYTLTLSGDVVLPSRQPSGGEVVVIDRTNAALTWLDSATCAPLRQLAVGTGFASNPHDLVMLTPTKAYVSRYGENAKATPPADDFDDGDDLLIIDPSQPKILGRIDLKSYAPAGVNILPLADRAILIEGKVYLSLNGIASDWTAYGTGRIVMVDPTTDKVVGMIDIPGAKDCGALDYLAAEQKLVVACQGSTGAQGADTSALVAIDLSVTPPAVVAQVSAAAAGGSAFSYSSIAALSGSNVFGVALGNFGAPPPDQLWSVSFAGTSPVKVFASTEGFALGALLADVEKGRIVVADGPTTSAALVRIFDLVAGTFSTAKTTDADPSHHLPPRALAWY